MCYSLWCNAPMMLPAGRLEAEKLYVLLFTVKRHSNTRKMEPEKVSETVIFSYSNAECYMSKNTTGILSAVINLNIKLIIANLYLY